MDTKAGRATIIRVDLLPHSRQTVTMPQHDAQTIVPSADPAPARTIRRRSEVGDAVRQRIKTRATEMFIRHGYNGVTFLDLSKELQINHSLVHYHFGTKAKLAEEVLRDFAESGIRENRMIWCSRDHTLFQKFVQARDRMYYRFVLFNPNGTMQHPTGLVSRFSMDAETISPELRKLVVDTQDELDRCVSNAVQIAMERGELRADAPAHRIMLQISSILFVAGPTARYGWEFTRLDDHFRGALETLLLAYGAQKELPSPWPKVKRARRKPVAKPEV